MHSIFWLSKAKPTAVSLQPRTHCIAFTFVDICAWCDTCNCVVQEGDLVEVETSWKRLHIAVSHFVLGRMDISMQSKSFCFRFRSKHQQRPSGFRQHAECFIITFMSVSSRQQRAWVTWRYMGEKGATGTNVWRAIGRKIFTFVECARSNFRRDACLIIFEDRLGSSFNVLVNGGGEEWADTASFDLFPSRPECAIDCGSCVASGILKLYRLWWSNARGI